MLYPIQSVADVGERDAIDVIRMSPKDSRLNPPLVLAVLHSALALDAEDQPGRPMTSRCCSSTTRIGSSTAL